MVCWLDGDFNLRRLERYLTLVRDSGAGAIVVLNKADLCESIAERVDAVTRLGAGTQVIAKCAQATVQPLRVFGRGRTVALLGSSGAGKSTIANRLLGEERQATPGVRPADSRGRHTTTNRMLLPVPGGGAISDHPGMRELQLWASQESLEGVFEDIAEAAGHCRFRDCTHQTSRDAALQSALERGEIDPARWRSYRKLEAELEHASLEGDAHAKAAQKKPWKAVHGHAPSHEVPEVREPEARMAHARIEARERAMELRKIGSLEVSVVGLGCNNFGWRIGPEESATTVDAAIAADINFFDTADVYGEGRSEEFLGRALGARRRKVIVATKFGIKMGEGKEGARPAYVKQAAEDSLRRLGTDYIDLCQIHRPDPQTPIAETLGALDELVRAGKVRAIGCSNFSAEQLRDATAAARPAAARFISVQNEYSLLKRDAEAAVLPECARLGIAFIPYFPLANGLLTGKYRAGEPAPEGSRAQAGFGPKVFTEQNLALAERLAKFAEAHGRTLLELAMSWLACQPAVASVIAGAKSAAQVKANAAAATWRLSGAELAELDRILRGGTAGAG